MQVPEPQISVLPVPIATISTGMEIWLASIVFPFVETKDLGKVYIERVAYRIGPKRGPEPDLGFVCKAREVLRRRGFIDGPPDVAIEIVSPDSVDRDYVAKRAMFEQAGVGEYWILDPDHHRATFLRLQEGKFIEVAPVQNIFRSQVLPGFEIDVRWLWAQPRPQAYEVLRRLLEGPSAP